MPMGKASEKKAWPATILSIPRAQASFLTETLVLDTHLTLRYAIHDASAVLFGAGDVLVQQAVAKKGSKHDPGFSALRAGALFGLPVTRWFQSLGRLQFTSPTKAIVYRTFLDPSLAAPSESSVMRVSFTGGTWALTVLRSRRGVVLRVDANTRGQGHKRHIRPAEHRERLFLVKSSTLPWVPPQSRVVSVGIVSFVREHASLKTLRSNVPSLGSQISKVATSNVESDVRAEIEIAKLLREKNKKWRLIYCKRRMHARTHARPFKVSVRAVHRHRKSILVLAHTHKGPGVDASTPIDPSVIIMIYAMP
ncbi:hypothetical protein EW146_g10241 [Bondarzewia mesenterica]|uniref:Uncharacterized protein n=1 Tax=Bondarzewia mesenterica TaxID=1095465 RepID=A0A4S4KZP8_9AGAM|nr:hypothetical protein EW146_g10241 [Bondarzewia mesenterica]